MRHVLAVGVLALVAVASCDRTGWQPDADCGRTGAACSVHGDCCSFACNGTCACAPVGEHCLADLACCDGALCVGERCVQGCRSEGDACDIDSDCCGGGCSDGVCADTCGIVDASCDDVRACCVGFECYRDKCVIANCSRNGETCSTSTPCCAGLTCESGTCSQAACTAQGQSCSFSDLCCLGLACDLTNRCTPCLASGSTCPGGEYPGGCCTPSYCDNGGCCRLPTESCTAAIQCCEVMYGTVVDRRCNSQGRCCHAGDEYCKTNADCCSGICKSNLLCERIALGGECQDAFDCAVGMCSAGRCCIASGQACTLGSDCCSGVCKNNNTCM